MNNVRMKLGAHVFLIISSILLSTIAVAASAKWIAPEQETPAYVTLAKRDIQKTQNEKLGLDRDFNLARASD